MKQTTEVERLKQEIVAKLTKKWWKFCFISSLVSLVFLVGLVWLAEEKLAEEKLAEETPAEETPAEVTVVFSDGTTTSWETEEQFPLIDKGEYIIVHPSNVSVRKAPLEFHTHRLPRHDPDAPLRAPKPWDYCPHCGSLRR